MSNRARIDQKLQLPQGLLGYTPSHFINDPSELIGFWRQAIAYRERFRHLQENIATFAVSTGSDSRLTSDNDIFEAIHTQFGELEVPQGTRSDQGWARVASLIDQADAETRPKN